MDVLPQQEPSLETNVQEARSKIYVTSIGELDIFDENAIKKFTKAMDRKYLDPMFAEGLRELKGQKFWQIACSRMQTVDLLACKAIMSNGYDLNSSFTCTIGDELIKREVEEILLGDNDADQKCSN